ncbi:MAG: hypothetical protein P8Y54_13770, partial [Xanthomonadales bacterium]
PPREASMTGPTQSFPIRFEPWYRVLSMMVLLPPSSAWLEVGPQEVTCQMGWAFRARLPHHAVISAERWPGRTPSRGVHGLAGRWLVNGSARLMGNLSARVRNWQSGYLFHYAFAMIIGLIGIIAIWVTL